MSLERGRQVGRAGGPWRGARGPGRGLVPCGAPGALGCQGGRSPRTGRNRRFEEPESHAGAVRCHVLRCIPQLGPSAFPRNHVDAPGAAGRLQRA